MAVPTRARARTVARDDVIRLAGQRVGIHRLASDVTRALRRAVPFDGVCLVTLDPTTMLPTQEIVENGLGPEAMPRLTEIELREPDFNKFTALARRARPAASLGEATGGALDRSVRQRELRRPLGFDDELRLVCVDATGAWGALTLLREAGRPPFTPAEVGFLASLSSPLAGGIRRAAFAGDTARPAERREAGLVVLSPANAVEMTNVDAERWLARLAPGASPAALPIVVLAVAAHTRRLASETGRADPADPADPVASIDDDQPAPRPAVARVRGTDGRWIVVRGSLVGDGPAASVAVMLEAAGGPDLAPLIADVHGLTDRERRVTELVAQGLSTNEIGDRLALSAYTVQDHLKSIFDKTGTGSRGDLVARLYFDHAAPRLRPSADLG